MLQPDEECREPDFKWGELANKGKDEGVKVYESFTYDGIEYFLYDCVYLYVEDEPEPYIGKLVKIWERRNGDKKVMVVWFFRQSDLVTYLKGYAPLKNEIFLASGDGEGVFNINDLRVINGKCNVVCTSTDKRNPQPSKQEIERADYVFSHTFDVGKLRITNAMKDTIAEIEVSHFFNKKLATKINNVPVSHSNMRETYSAGFEKFKSVKAVRCEAKDRSANCIAGAGSTGEEANRTSDKGRERERFLDEKTTLLPKNGPNRKGGSITGEEVNRTSDKGRECESFLDGKTVSCPKNDTKRKSEEALHGPDRKKTYHGEEGVSNRSCVLTKEQDRDRWFKYSWEERLEAAFEKRSLVLLENLDPSYSSEDVQDIIEQALGMKCTAKMIPRNAFSSPLNGQAFAIFRSREEAQTVIDKLQDECCILEDDRPLIASHGTPSEPKKLPQENSRFTGHIAIERPLHRQWSEQDAAVSTSHFAQPNTIEYDMAVEWIQLQKQFDQCWKQLHEEYEKEWNVLRSKLRHR